MLDVARHFFSVDEVKRVHRPDRPVQGQQPAPAPGRRPGLAASQINSWPQAGHRTAAAPRSAAARAATTRRRSTRTSSRYAASRYITVVPEIDMPGHTNAALASYAELNCNGVAPAALHRHRRRLQLAVRGQGRHLQVPRRRRPRARGADARPVPPHRRRRGALHHRTPTTRRSWTRCSRSSPSTARPPIGWHEIAEATPPRGAIAQYWGTLGDQTRTSRRRRPEGHQARDVAGEPGLPGHEVRPEARRSARTGPGYIEVQDRYDWDPATFLTGVPPKRGRRRRGAAVDGDADEPRRHRVHGVPAAARRSRSSAGRRRPRTTGTRTRPAWPRRARAGRRRA